MTIGEPPTWVPGAGEARAAPDPLTLAIARAAARMTEVGESYPLDVAFADENVVGTVDYAVRLSAAIEPSQWSALFRSYFIESIASLALTRAVSGAPPLHDEQVASLLRDAFDVLTPVCRPA